MAPTSVTASMLAMPTGISPDPRNLALDTPSCSTTLATHHHAPPQPFKHHRRLTVTNEAGSSRTGRANREREAARQQPRRRNHLHRHLRTPTGRCDRNTPGPLGPAEPERAREVPVYALQCTRRRHRRPELRPSLRPPRGAPKGREPARPDPDGARRAQIWARQVEPRATAPSRGQRASPPRRCDPPPRRQGGNATAGTAPTWEHRHQTRRPRVSPSYARGRAAPLPPAPHGALPDGLRRRRRLGRPEEGGEGGLGAGPSPAARGERQQGPGERRGWGSGAEARKAWRRWRRRRGGTLESFVSWEPFVRSLKTNFICCLLLSWSEDSFFL